jgi:hypothetical protein
MYAILILRRVLKIKYGSKKVSGLANTCEKKLNKGSRNSINGVNSKEMLMRFIVFLLFSQPVITQAIDYSKNYNSKIYAFW